MPRRLFPFAAFLALSLCLPAASAGPRIVTSIEPLRDLAAALAAGVGEAQSLIPGDASAHHFALRPSQLASLSEADLVIWIDRHFESGFAGIDTLAAAGGGRLELGPALGLDEKDYHLWYSPRLLGASARLIAEALVALDPANASRYQDNYERLAAALAGRGDTLRRRLRRDGPLLLTDHAFLETFAAEFEMTAVAALRDRHEGGGSLGELRRLEQRLRAEPASCLLTSDPEPSPLGARLARKYGLAVVSLRPEDRPGEPLRHLDRLLQALQSCDSLGSADDPRRDGG